jgi:S1-C subfamily serine protease
MKKLLIVLLAMVFSFSVLALDKPPVQSQAEFIDQVLYPATVLLYEQDEQGGMNMLCTATAIEKIDKGYYFATASHCAAEEDESKKEVRAIKTFFFITPDESGTKNFIKAEVVVCGYRHRGDDFCIFKVLTDKVFPVIGLGVDEVLHGGQDIFNVASPLGLGKQVFKGVVSSPKLDRPIVVEDINWTNTMLVQLFGTNGGSSGSAIICANQRAICGFLVGTINGTEVVAVPVSRFKAFRDLVNAKKYKWFKDSDE